MHIYATEEHGKPCPIWYRALAFFLPKKKWITYTEHGTFSIRYLVRKDGIYVARLDTIAGEATEDEKIAAFKVAIKHIISANNP